MSQPPLLFINGFHRSGTTVMASAATDALGGVTTTVGVLARHIPALAAFLETLTSAPADRGADRLPITPSTPEEYGFLLHQRTGTHALYGHPDGVALLREHIEELGAEAPQRPIVLKNPWEVGHEAQLLADFPTARVIILHRRLADIECSVGRALMRSSSSAYSRALDGDTPDYHRLLRRLASRRRRRLLLRAIRLVVRARAYGLAAAVEDLPGDRVAFLSYDELRADPFAGAAWAAHLLDSHALAEAFSQLAFSEPGVRAPASAVQRAVDHRWRRAWGRARAGQVRAGLVARPPESGRGRRARPATAPGPPGQASGLRVTRLKREQEEKADVA